MKMAVINSSPLILLFETELEFILKEIFSEIIIPQSVWSEVCESGENDKASLLLPSATWIKKEIISIEPEVASWDLGRGETSVLSFALKNRNHIAVVDDRLARKFAEVYNIALIGTGGLLVVAKRLGLLKSISQHLINLQKAGLYISRDVVNVLLKEAEEL
jgi:predicted nucleic acid-binding protein